MGFGYPVGLRGEASYQAAIAPLTVGQEVQLVAEPDNAHDPRAVRVEAGGAVIGYVPRDNWTCRVLHEERGQVHAVVKEIFRNDRNLLDVILAANTADRMPAIPAALPPVTGTVELECDCGHKTSAPVLGLEAETGVKCEACDAAIVLPDDVYDDILDRFLEKVVDKFWDSDLEAPDDDVILLMQRLGHWPSMAELLLS